MSSVLLGFLFFRQTAQAEQKTQKVSNRLRNNYELFLNATPEELARLEKDKETREACIEVSNTLYLLSAMTKEELAPYKEGFHQQQRTQRLDQNRGRGGLAH